MHATHDIYWEKIESFQWCDNNMVNVKICRVQISC